MIALAATTVALIPGQARAIDECGAEVTGGPADTITCTGSSYPTAITYTGSTGLTLNLDNPAMVVTSTGYGVVVQSGAVNTNDVVINANNLTSVTAGNASALRARG